MNKKAKLIIWIIISVVIFAVAIWGYNTLSSRYTEGAKGTKTPVKTERDTAPDFTVLNEGGEEVLLSDLKGKNVIVNFWASWCPPCKAELPDFEKIYKEYGDKVEIMIVNMTDGAQETIEKAKEHISENGYTFPVYYDTQLSAAMAYNVMSIPQTYIIDTEGKIVKKISGMTDYKTLKDVIESMR